MMMLLMIMMMILPHGTHCQLTVTVIFSVAVIIFDIYKNVKVKV